MASLPNSSAIARKREAISSSASSQEMRFQSRLESLNAGTAVLGCPGPLGLILRMGYSTRSGEYTLSKYFETFAHRNPRVTGCSGSPWIFVARPSCTVINTPQASGQSCGQAAFTICFMLVRLYVPSFERLSLTQAQKEGWPKAARLSKSYSVECPTSGRCCQKWVP